MEFEFLGQKISDTVLKQEKWLNYLYFTRENLVNLERVDTVEELSARNFVLEYVERTLQVLKSITNLTDLESEYVATTLKWSEVSKCGMPEQRQKWQALGMDLRIHNEASAQIYAMEAQSDFTLDQNQSALVQVLIATHGLLGQYIRGETGFEVHKPLEELITSGQISADSLRRVLLALNHCIIEGVDPKLWTGLQDEVARLVDVICSLKSSEEQTPMVSRLKKLFSAYRRVEELTPEEEAVYASVTANNDLWYAESALDTFSRKEITTIFSLLAKESANTRHISFYKLAKNLTYDYENHRKINVYKKRIVELCLREYAEDIEDMKSKEHVTIYTETVGDTLYFDVKFTKVCESLITFCVEAERSKIMTYEKSIQTIFDLFGFRRDIFDRLNNEEQYLETMNNAAESTKLSILDYVCGNKIVDVGSGGGVLLDLMEKKFPDKEIIGTDISQNVIETLIRKIQDEGHHYTVLRHNFVESALEAKVDTVIFSSILHEVYSYTPWEGHRFQIDAVKTALRNAYDSIPAGGRIVIRDGVMADSETIASVRFKKSEGSAFAADYMRDFKGLTYLRNESNPAEWNSNKVRLEGDVLTADVNFLREALYTYTWGPGSYPQEVQEQFGYFTYKDYLAFLQELGMKIVFSNMFTEPGYPDNLNDKVELLDGLSWDQLPSTIIIAAEK